MAPRLRYHTRFVPAPSFHIADLTGDTSATYQSVTSDQVYSYIRSSPFHTSSGHSSNRTVASSITASEIPHDYPQLVSSIGLLVILASVAAVIILIAFVIGKVRRKQNSIDVDIERAIKPMDPYEEAIQFPEDTKQEWHQVVKTSLKSATQKIKRKTDSPDNMTIPEELKYQLKYIYVY